MTRTLIATLANFFLPGAGYLILGQRIVVSVFFLVGVIGLTYVEFGIQVAAPAYYWPMFVSVLVMNTGFAIDAYRLGSSQQGETRLSAAA
jgi:hypothetical protein